MTARPTSIRSRSKPDSVTTRRTRWRAALATALAAVVVMAPGWPDARAQDLTNMQQRAAAAYRTYEQAEQQARDADRQSAEAAAAEADAEARLAVARKQAAEAKQRAEKSKAAASAAKVRWEEADKALEAAAGRK